MNTLYHLHVTGLFSVLLSHVERIVYTYIYVYEVMWRADGDESLSICVRVA